MQKKGSRGMKYHLQECIIESIKEEDSYERRI